MQLAIRLPYHVRDASGETSSRIAVAADEAGMHSGWVADHVVFRARETTSSTPTTADGRYPRPFDENALEAWTCLSYVAGTTKRLRLGVGDQQPGKFDASSPEALADELTRYEEAGVDVLLCETTVRTGEALARLLDVLHAAGPRRSMLAA